MNSKPAESPEARVTPADAALVADILELSENLSLGGNDIAAIRNGIWNDEPSDLRRLLRIAARPTERGAVEDAIAGAREFVDAADAEGFDAADALDMIREFAALPATDQAVEFIPPHIEERVARYKRVLALSKIIDDELAAQTAVQDGCTYIPMDNAGVSVATTNIVVTQLAGKILDALD